MKKIIIPILVMVFVFSFAWTAGAQTSRPETQKDKTGETYRSNHPQEGSMENYRASKLIGMKIQNRQEDNLGKIEDLAVNSKGDIDVVIVSHGGALGIGEKYAAVPFNAFSRKDDKTMVLDISKEKMADAPTLDNNRWPDMRNRKWSEDVYGYYGQKPYWREPSQSPKTGETYGSRQTRDGSIDEYKASKFIGAKLRNHQGDNLGDIEDLAVNSRGHIDFVIVSHGGALGIGEKYAAVPFNAFSREDDRTMILDISKEKMAEAPNFDKNRWPDMSDRKWSEDVYHYYGQTPYWREPSRSHTENENKKMK